MTGDGSVDFPCTAGGDVAAGRRRLRTLLVGITVLMLGLALWLVQQGRIFPGILAAAVAVVAWISWRLSGELDPVRLTIVGGDLVVRMRQHQRRIPLAGASARPLTEPELLHLRRLASVGPVVAGSGSFDSHLLGEFDLHASDLASAVLVESGEDRVVLTPDDGAAFLAAVRDAS